MASTERRESLLRDIAEKINVDGLKEISDARSRPTRIIWVVVVILSAGLSVFYAYRVMAEYIDNNTATKVAHGERCRMRLIR
jgi:hypothetical protein